MEMHELADKCRLRGSRLIQLRKHAAAAVDTARKCRSGNDRFVRTQLAADAAEIHMTRPSDAADHVAVPFLQGSMASWRTRTTAQDPLCHVTKRRMRRLQARRVGIPFVVVAVALTCLLIAMLSLRAVTSASDEVAALELRTRCGDPTINILFLKTHKCASSTVQNILMRVGLSRGATFALPRAANYLGNPVHFVPEMVGPELRTADGKYNMFVHHTRYNPRAMRAVMYPDAKFVTIVRQPVDLYESLYAYYNLAKVYNISLHSFLSFPVASLASMPRFTKKLGFNQMSWDLGMDPHSFRNSTAVEAFVKKIENDFHLVMVAELFEASLVLLSDLMCWSLEELSYVNLNTRRKEMKINLTEDERNTLLILNGADEYLYNYFVSKLRQKIRDYGFDKMKKKILQLTEINDKLYSRCVGSVALPQDPHKPFTYRTKDLLVDYRMGCFYVTRDEMAFTEDLRKRQKAKLQVVRRLEQFMAGEDITETTTRQGAEGDVSDLLSAI